MCFLCSWRSGFMFVTVAVGAAFLGYWYVTRFVATSHPVAQSKVIFAFLGAPGSGKGTLADRCVRELGYSKLSTGDLCRDNIKQGTELGKKLQEFTSTGALVPDEIIASMVKEWLDVNTKDGKSIILDGFPRTATQAALLLDLIKKQYPDYKLRVISLNISDEGVVQRIAGRLTCSNQQCKAIYNIKQFAPGQENLVCPSCKSPLVKREDDREEVVRARLKVYADTSTELLNFFRNAGFEIEEINVEGKEADEVFGAFKKLG